MPSAYDCILCFEQQNKAQSEPESEKKNVHFQNKTAKEWALVHTIRFSDPIITQIQRS